MSVVDNAQWINLKHDKRVNVNQQGEFQIQNTRRRLTLRILLRETMTQDKGNILIIAKKKIYK
jgi:hypothetical protein